MKTVLVIGGSYFVGKVFVELVSSKPDYQLAVLNRGHRPLGIRNVEEIVCDRNHTSRLREYLAGRKWHAVVDFCAYTPSDIRNLMLGFPEGGIEHYIFVSTSSVYAPTRALPITENAPKLTGPQPEHGPAANYGFQKWLSEQAVATYAKRLNVPYTCLRPTIIYGKYNYAPREAYFFATIHQNRAVVIPESDLALFQFVSVWDVAEIIQLCLGNPDTFGEAYNLSAEELVSYGRFVEILEAVVGRTIRTKKVSAKEIREKRIPLPFPLDNHLIYSGAKIRETLGFQYTSLMEGMRQTYTWYCESRLCSH